MAGFDPALLPMADLRFENPCFSDGDGEGSGVGDHQAGKASAGVGVDDGDSVFGQEFHGRVYVGFAYVVTAGGESRAAEDKGAKVA